MSVRPNGFKNSVYGTYLFSHDGKEECSYLSADILCEGRAPNQEVDIGCLEHSRNFLGWASSVEGILGRLCFKSSPHSKLYIVLERRKRKYDEIDWAGLPILPQLSCLGRILYWCRQDHNGQRPRSNQKAPRNIPIHPLSCKCCITLHDSPRTQLSRS